jgi:hypothetical protein
MEDGIDESEIVGLFQGDKQLVDMWKNCLIHTKWINPLKKTEKGVRK